MLTLKELQLHEMNLGRLWQHNEKSNWGMITSFRGDKSLQDNKKTNSQLEREIRVQNFGFVKVIGHYIENLGSSDERKVREESYIVISSPADKGKLKTFLIKQGQKYNQDTVLYKEPGKNPILIGTNHNSWLGLGKTHQLGSWHPNKLSSIYTQMTGHSSFTFDFAETTSEMYELTKDNQDLTSDE